MFSSCRPRRTHLRLVCAALAASTLVANVIARPDAAVAAPVPAQTANTLVATGVNDMANWGGHQARVVRTPTGLYTTYLTGTSQYALIGHVARQNPNGTWTDVASMVFGREPGSLLAGPGGMLYLIAAPRGVVTLFTATPAATGPVQFAPTVVPGLIEGNFPYLSAGTNELGDLCVVISNGGDSPLGELYVSCRRGGQAAWSSRMYETEYRYAYTHVLPRADGSLILVNTRDTTWGSLGYQQPPGKPDYAFDRFSVWRTDQSAGPLTEISSVQATPTSAGEYVYANAQADAMIDSQGRIHVLYHFADGTTGHEEVNRHRLLSSTGALIADHPVAADSGFQYMKMYETGDGSFWLFLNGAGVRSLDPLTGSTTPQLNIDTSGREVWYSGYALTSPQTGSPRGADAVDAVYLGNGTEWRHLQVSFSTRPPAGLQQLDRAFVGTSTSQMSGWGGNQSRVVTTATGTWTVTAHDSAGALIWRLWQRNTAGTWTNRATGPAGYQPANLVTEPDGTLTVVATPAGRLTTWRGKPTSAGAVSMVRDVVPGVPDVELPYASAGANQTGDVCVSVSTGGEARGGKLYLACRRGSGAWTTRTVSLPYRNILIRLFPGTDGTVVFTGDRNTSWSSLGFAPPPSGNTYAANALGVWRINMTTGATTALTSVVENRTTAYPEPSIWTIDSFVDGQGRLHLLYWQAGRTTSGAQRLRHRIVSATGSVLSTRTVTGDYATYMTMFQTPDGTIHAVHSNGGVAALDVASSKFTRELTLDLLESSIEHAGVSVATPRTGTASSPGAIAMTFPTSGGTRLFAVRLGYPV